MVHLVHLVHQIQKSSLHARMRAGGPTMAKLVDQVDQRGTIGPYPGNNVQQAQAVVDQCRTRARAGRILVHPES